MLLTFVLQLITAKWVSSFDVELLECSPPDYPQWGGYGPRQDYYLPGDTIHYYCDTETYIGGNYYRRCEDNGDWSGFTPVCDPPAVFSSVRQTTTADPIEENEAEAATDGSRTTCSSTKGVTGSYWIGNLTNPGQVLRVMLFLPKADLEYEIFVIKRDQTEFSCGSKRANIDRYEWTFQNCVEPHNTNVVAIKIKSLSDKPLQLCEVVTHTLTDPTCVDPRHVVENGRLIITRKTASLVCDAGYTRSPDARLECVRTGVWNRKTLYCLEREWEVEGIAGAVSNNEPQSSQPRSPGERLNIQQR